MNSEPSKDSPDTGDQSKESNNPPEGPPIPATDTLLGFTLVIAIMLYTWGFRSDRPFTFSLALTLCLRHKIFLGGILIVFAIFIGPALWRYRVILKAILIRAKAYRLTITRSMRLWAMRRYATIIQSFPSIINGHLVVTLDNYTFSKEPDLRYTRWRSSVSGGDFWQIIVNVITGEHTVQHATTKIDKFTTIKIPTEIARLWLRTKFTESSTDELRIWKTNGGVGVYHNGVCVEEFASDEEARMFYGSYRDMLVKSGKKIT